MLSGQSNYSHHIVFGMGEVPETNFGDFVLKRRNTMKLSLRDAAIRSEGALTYGHWQQLEKNVWAWENVKYQTIRGIERALDMNLEELWNMIHSPESNPQPVKAQRLEEVEYVSTIIVILSPAGEIAEEKTVTVARAYAGRKLFGFQNQHNTVLGVAPGQSVKVAAAKIVKPDKMVLVKAGGQLILAYALDAKATRVITAQGLELRTEKLWGEVVEYLTDENSFMRSKTN
jgi:hypothetical protein